MRLLLTALIFVAGLFSAIMGLQFLFAPGDAALGFGMEAGTTQGLATFRADMTAFFLVAGGCLMWGSWRRAGDMLLVPAALYGIAFTGRLVSVVADGAYSGFWLPMLFEAAVVVLAVAGNRLLPHHTVEEIAG
jgi:hypothetical protein